MQTHKLLFLCSGGGGNLRVVHKLWEEGFLNRIDSISVVADRECPATDWSNAQGLRTDVLMVTRDTQDDLIRICELHEPSVIVTNIHKILGPAFTSRYAGSLVNLHYSILPSFSGLIGAKTVTKALEYGAKIIGATAHHVTEDLDGGQPLAQVAYGISNEDTPQDVMDAMFRAGSICLFNALQAMLDSKELTRSAAIDRGVVFEQTGRPMLANPCYGLPESLLSSELWRQIKA